jgi:Holliday junction resolvase-like predicted endonuclease
MKKANKFDLWMDRAVAQWMKKTGQIDLIKSRESASALIEVPIFQTLPLDAEASDFLSINEWMESREDNKSMGYGK